MDGRGLTCIAISVAGQMEHEHACLEETNYANSREGAPRRLRVNLGPDLPFRYRAVLAQVQMDV
jgi:hypothetical protein